MPMVRVSNGGTNFSLVWATQLSVPAQVTSNKTVVSGKSYLIVLGLALTNYGTFTQADIDGVSLTGGTITKRTWIEDQQRKTAYHDMAQCLFWVTATSNTIKFSLPTNVGHGYGYTIIEL